ncbi:MAG: hypothetical protein IID32_11565 [Planctomycetes bacterium]|nr:hypothetical protein [Planctomycetota bacterium]
MSALEHNEITTDRLICAAEVFVGCGIYSGAREYYRKALKIEPNNQQAIDGIKFIEDSPT